MAQKTSSHERQNAIRLTYEGREVKPGDKVTPEIVDSIPLFHWFSQPSDFDSLIFYLAKGEEVSDLLYAAVNIPHGRLDLSEQLAEYRSPREEGSYRVELFRQPRRIVGASEATERTEILALLPPRPIASLNFEVVSSKEESEEEEARGRRCRCILHVAAKQSDACLRNPKLAGKIVEGRVCYNPYPVCVKSTGVGGRVNCRDYYDFRSLPLEELRAFAVMEGIDLPRTFSRDSTGPPASPGWSRDQLIRAIEKWKKAKDSK